MSTVEDFLTPTEEAEIIEAIRKAEKHTSGEIRVHLEAQTDLDPTLRATHVFDFLHMNNTKQSNGVLIYVAVEDRHLVILGDKGINQAVPMDFWESTKDLILKDFSKGHRKEGLVKGILEAGQQLKHHFPYQIGDRNELSDEISTS